MCIAISNANVPTIVKYILPITDKKYYLHLIR